MFARLFAVASVATLALAGPGPLTARDQCNSGPINCCNNVMQANQANSLLGLLGPSVATVFAGVTGDIAWNCSPLSVVGLGSTSCTAQTVCCTGNKFNGLVQVGCSPVNLGA